MSFSRAERAHVVDWWLSVDRTLLALILTLALAGLAASLIASPSAAFHLKHEPFYFVKRHALGMAFALAAMFLVSLLNPPQIKRFALFLFVTGALLMIGALLQGSERNGAMRWLVFGGAVIQPSEFAKPGFVVLCAWLFTESVKRPDMPALELALLMLAIMVSLLVLQPDIGQTIIISCVWCGLLFLSGYSLRFLPRLGRPRRCRIGGGLFQHASLYEPGSTVSSEALGRLCKPRSRLTPFARQGGWDTALARVSRRRGFPMLTTILSSPPLPRRPALLLAFS